MQLASGTLLQGGKYRIIRTLGQGGFGITYEAEQVLLHRTVAIKEFFMGDCCERGVDERTVIRVGTESQRELVNKFLNKFIKEAQTIAGFEHPHIIKILDIFEENDTAYYVMEFHSNGSLADLLHKSGPLTEDLAIKYIRQVASALCYIHEHNTVHLDVKPSNILLNKNGDTILIDFGTSKHYDSAGEQTSTTPIGYSKGYAPLEQYRDGDVKQFTPATDIYALGATLYALLTGNNPPEASIVYEEGLKRIEGVSDFIWSSIFVSMSPKRIERPQDIDIFLSLINNSVESTVILDLETEDKKENVLQVYEEYVVKGGDTIKNNPLKDLFLHCTFDKTTNKKKCWYEVNGERRTDFFENGSRSPHGFLLHVDNYFYALPVNYYLKRDFIKWAVDFGDNGFGIWTEYQFSTHFTNVHEWNNVKPYEWSGAEYPRLGNSYLIEFDKSNFARVVIIYDDRAILMTMMITEYSKARQLLTGYRGEIRAKEVSRINRDTHWGRWEAGKFV